MKKNKKDLRRNEVDSANMHVGIELELHVPKYEERYLDEEDRCCEDCDCNRDYVGEDTRDRLENELIGLIGNNSIKVVEDGSLRPDEDETDAEVCWNYFISKETVKDNAKILQHLRDVGADFTDVCGLHINLNNYLDLPQKYISKEDLDFLFYFVAPSRRLNNYCNNHGMANDEKYSMIYHQGRVLEFRFFSPTLNAEKLNNYVALANFIYKRMAGIDCRLSSRLEKYFRNKIELVHDLDAEQINMVMNKLNTIPSLKSKQKKLVKTGATKDRPRDEMGRFISVSQAVIDEVIRARG